MALPQRANGEVQHRELKKLVNGEALASLEEGWLQYKEELKKKQRSPVKTRLDFNTLSIGESPISASSFTIHTPLHTPLPSRKACILSIDGGGMRGIIPARVLSYLEDSLKKKSGNPNARIADFFDIVAGTSVGGLIGTMLCTNDGNGKPLFSGEEASRLITDKGKQIFKIPPLRRPFAKLRGILTPRYSTKNLEHILRQHLARDGRELTLRDTLKPILIPCYDLSTAGAFLFSRADALQSESFDFRLVDVCRATAAVPGFFKPAKLSSVDGKTSVVGIDGGLIMNNPAAAAITHVLHNTEEFPYVRTVGDTLVLSLGTGLFDRGYGHEEVKRWGAFQWAKPVARIVLDGISDMVDHFMSMAFRDHRNNYVRLQVSGLPRRCLMEMDDPSRSNVRRLTKIADDMLAQPCMEHIPFGGKRQLPVTNRERLDWFADCLVAEQRARASELSS